MSKSSLVFYKIIFFIFLSFQSFSQNEYRSLDGKVIFTSSKEMNILTAYSENLLTHLVPGKNKVNFKVQVTSFNFSNCSRLVERLFNDVYMESHKYHWAQFEGVIKDTIDFKKPGEYIVEVAGKLSIHGVTKDRTIKGKIIVKDTGLLGFESTFPIQLSDHNINILPDDIARLSQTINVQISSAIGNY